MKINYRPEIDGLRAIAVIAVILYHAKITILGNNFFQGGFIGVDIFFVISGYLITSLILKELEITGKFSFTYFYQRRARRILPVLFVVILASLPVAWLYLLPSSIVEFSKSILYSLGFSSNFYFHFTGLEYGDLEGRFKPLLHTWSLSVEEQFYVLFPIILFLSYKYFKKNLLNIMLIGFVISISLAEWGSRSYESATFYFLHSRMWELLAGSILAYFEIKRGRNSNYKFLNNLLPFTGLILITYSILFYSEKTLHPSLQTLVPVIGVSMIIWYSKKDELITKILSTKLFVGTGLISYSLYLWHFPVFAFARYSSIVTGYDIIKKILVAIFIIGLSILSYFFVEKIFRNKNILSLKQFIIIIISLFIITSISSTFIIFGKGYKDRFFNTKNFQLDNKHYLKERGKYLEKSKDSNINIFNKFDKKNILIVGNSHADDTFNILYNSGNLFNNLNFAISSLQIDCFFEFIDQKKTKCGKQKNTNVPKNFKNSHTIILSTLWYEQDLEALNQSIKNLLKFNKKIIIMSQSPTFNWKNIYTELDLFVLKNKRMPNSIEEKLLSKKLFEEINKNTFIINDKLKLISKKNYITFLDKMDYVCNIKAKTCDILTNNKEKIFFDNSHYTLAGADHFRRKIYLKDWFRIY